jgi:hypothetical protein
MTLSHSRLCISVILINASPVVAAYRCIIVLLLRSYTQRCRERGVQIEKTTASNRADSRVAEYLVRSKQPSLGREGELANDCLLLLLYVHYPVYHGPAQQQWLKTTGSAVAGPWSFVSETRETQNPTYTFPTLRVYITSMTHASCPLNSLTKLHIRLIALRP